MADVLQEMTLSDFLAWEPAQPVRHEFHRGHVRPVDNGRRVHDRVVGNLAAALGERLDGLPCQVLCTSMPVQVGDEAVLYPDVLVTCDRDDLAAGAVFRAPTLVMEVLAPGSVAWDWSEKFSLYRHIAALREYVLIDPDTHRVEAFRRSADGPWTFHDMSNDSMLALPGIGCGVGMEKVFGGFEGGLHSALLSGEASSCVGRELIRFANYFVIPAQAGTQAVPKLAASNGGGRPTFAFVSDPASRLAIRRGTAWVPACAGMTE